MREGERSQHFITSASDLDTSCWNRLVRPLLLDNRTCATLSKTASAACTIHQYDQVTQKSYWYVISGVNCNTMKPLHRLPRCPCLGHYRYFLPLHMALCNTPFKQEYRSLTFLNSSWGWFGFRVDVVGEQTGKDVVMGTKRSDCVRLEELSVHLLHVGTETKGNPSFFRRLQSLGGCDIDVQYYTIVCVFDEYKKKNMTLCIIITLAKACNLSLSAFCCSTFVLYRVCIIILYYNQH